MFCPRCGKENLDNAQLCRFCSSVLTGVSSPPSPQAKTSGLAITSFVLGILSIFTCFVTAIPAIIFGIVALVKISKSAGRLKGNGLAIAGIAIPPASPPVVALLMGMLMGIMMPALARTRSIAQRMVCGANLSGLSKAMLIYANDCNDMYPTSSKWCDLLIEHADMPPQMFVCKAASEGPCNYAMNKNIEKLGTNSPPDMVLLFESKPGWNQSGGPEILTTENHNGDGCNVSFVDGHVEFVKTEYLKNLKWEGKEYKIAPFEPPPSPQPPLRVVPLRGEKGNEKGAPEPNQ